MPESPPLAETQGAQRLRTAAIPEHRQFHIFFQASFQSVAIRIIRIIRVPFQPPGNT